MSDVFDSVAKARHLPDCAVHPAVGFPDPFRDKKLSVPNDLREFYSICGGIDLFAGSEYPLTIVGPTKFRMANPQIVGNAIENDITHTWYIFAEGRSGEYLTIDLNPDRTGRCYDSYFDRHGIIGSCPIVASSFTEFLTKVLSTPGARFYWLLETFHSSGDAYDI